MSNGELVLLDALAFGRVDVGRVFLGAEPFSQFFNLSWHGLSFSDCCKSILRLVEGGYVDVTEEEILGGPRTAIGLSRKGGELWLSEFVVDLGLLIVDSTYQVESGWTTGFVCTSREHLSAFHSEVLEMPLSPSARVSTIAPNSNYELFGWKMALEAFGFSVYSPDPDWPDSSSARAIASRKAFLSQGWRKPPLRP